jgi:hypothetical protein
MGAGTFLKILQEKANEDLGLIQVVLGLTTQLEVAELIVKTYRTQYKKISSLPKTVFHAFKYLTSSIASRSVTLGNKTFRIQNHPKEKALSVTLSTGGHIIYRDIQCKLVPSKYDSQKTDTEVSYAFNKKRTVFTFSSPIENIVQATARDIFAQQMLDAERVGLDLRFHTHDEAVFCVPKRNAIDRLNQVKHLFSNTSLPCNGLPLACKVRLSDRITKDELYMQRFEQKLTLKEAQ